LGVADLGVSAVDHAAVISDIAALEGMPNLVAGSVPESSLSRDEDRQETRHQERRDRSESQKPMQPNGDRELLTWHAVESGCTRTDSVTMMAVCARCHQF